MSLLPRIMKSFLTTNSGVFINKSCMSVFAPYYVEPVFKKESLNELISSGEALKIAGSPVKPAQNDQTCSYFHDDTVKKFTNYIMREGKKVLARELLEKTFENIKRSQIERYHLTTDSAEREKIELDPVVILHKAVENCRPIVNLCPVKRGGVTYQVPIPLTEKRSNFLSMKWLIEAAKEKPKKNTPFHIQLGWELLDAANNRGRVVKQKIDVHRQCEANRAYAHYRWS